MSRLVIWFVALVTVIGLSKTVEGSPLPAKARDLSKVVQFIQQLQQPNEPNKQRILRLRIASSDSDISSDSYSDSESSEDDKKRIARADKKRIASKNRLVGLLEKVANEKSKNDRPMNRKGKTNNEKTVKLHDADNTRFTNRIIDLIEEAAANEKKKYVPLSNRKSKVNHGRNGYLFRSVNYDNAPNSNDYIQKQILEKLLSQTNVEELQPKLKKRLVPNTLTGPTTTMDDVYEYFGTKNEEPTGLEDYSKVYIVLNPEAVKNSKNKSSLNDLIARILSLSSQTQKRDQQVEPFRYKGFVVNQNLVKRRFKEAQNKISRMGDEEKKLDPIAIPFERITAPPV